MWDPWAWALLLYPTTSLLHHKGHLLLWGRLSQSTSLPPHQATCRRWTDCGLRIPGAASLCRPGFPVFSVGSHEKHWLYSQKAHLIPCWDASSKSRPNLSLPSTWMVLA